MPGSIWVWFSASMMKRIMNTRVAALALAATPLLAAPAFADAPGRTVTASPAVSLNLGDASLYVSVGHDRWRDRNNGRHYRTNEWGQRPWEVRQLKREALNKCVRAVQRQGYRAGFRDVDIDDDYRVRQIGPRGFDVRLRDVEFEGRRRDFDTRVSCTVRQGTVRNISGLPQPGHRNNDRGRDWSRNDNDQGRRTGPGGQRSYGDDGLRGGRRGS